MTRVSRRRTSARMRRQGGAQRRRGGRTTGGGGREDLTKVLPTYSGSRQALCPPQAHIAFFSVPRGQHLGRDVVYVCSVPKPRENPPNRFERAHLEWEGEAPPADLVVYEERCKSALSENKSPDVGFRWSVNPYRGCFHGCAYCYARPTHPLSLIHISEPTRH